MTKYKVCLDAGHYGKYNRSPANKEYYESDMTWKLHLLLKKELEALGVEVITTRTNQATDLALTSRGKKSKGCHLFLSLHSNAVGSNADEKTDYPLVVVPVSGKGDELGKALSKCIAKTMQTKQEGKYKSRKGINGDWYGVMCGAASVGTVGLLVEHSFHTNTRSTNWLLNDSNLAKLAKAEAGVIFDWLKENFKLEEDKAPASIYRVQIGAYAKKSGANTMVFRLNDLGYKTAIVKSGSLYKVQVGAYRSKASAEATVKKLAKQGIKGIIVV
ncbi:MAG: N-acetylmuramoyl-L-alanine amidase [Oscillospiraceae bacterium]|nr:N-acetylmuramoyl-L-alanine amidase [Oscillospiraceae bacterium]